MNRHRRRPAVLSLVVLAVVCAAALSGCGLFGGKTATDRPPEVKVDAKGRVENSQATLVRDVDGYHVTVDVLELKRYDKAMRLTFALTPQSKGSDEELDSDVLSDDGLGSDVGGVYLLDTAGLRMYPVLRAGEDACVCSDDLSSYPLDQPTPLFADFPVPPDSVRTMTVVFGNLGPLPGVKVS